MSALLPVTAAFGVAATTAPLLPGVPPVVTWGALAAGYVSLVAHGSACVGARLLGTAVCRLDGRCDAVALTFDDGPDPATTPRLLDLLREHRARATFCCIGERVRAAPAIVRRIRDEGHVLGNHSDQHSSFSPFYFAGRLQRELVACQQAIEVAAGVAPRWF
ncbi:MAG TPA: polysaccharide deacetylase family protein, partial [Planctomycetota bacterium]|nr:polysaccharide deacetylase family protein [Planctomycetota bacterium]